ncbi:MAG: NACHT domain-containing protein, partial [Nitrospirae bacterium]
MDYNDKPISKGLKTKLESLLQKKPILFIGYSLSDSDFQRIYFGVLDRIGNLKPKSFVVIPFPSKDSPYYGQRYLFRQRWEKRGVEFIDAKAGEFLKALDDALRGTKENKTKFVPTKIRTFQEVLKDYNKTLSENVGKVRIFGKPKEQELNKVFVELNIVEEYERPVTHRELKGMMESWIRERREIFTSHREEVEEKKKRTIKPDELLKSRTHAIITGAPGCGKTTILKYLTTKTIEENKNLPVFLELKNIRKSEFEKAGDLKELLFNKAVSNLIHLNKKEKEDLKEHFFNLLAEGGVSIFLDGLDEIKSADFFEDLCRAVKELLSSEYGNSNIIITTRPYALEVVFENMKEMEISPMNQEQIEEFLIHYYGDTPEIRRFREELKKRRYIKSLIQNPFLLSVITYLYFKEGEIIGERLELYRQIVAQLTTQLDREKGVKRFHILDPDGSIKKAFIEKLAFDKFFIDDVKKDVERLIFTDEDISKKAEDFCKKRVDLCRIHKITPDLLASDIKATPFLREIGTGTYAFSHLTIQEYLAASVFSKHEDIKKLFCRAFFDSTLVEMEILSMTMGLVKDPNELYKHLEQLPESLNFTNLRLRARGLAYVSDIDESHLKLLSERLIDFIKEKNPEETPYKDVVLRSFALSTGKCSGYLIKQITLLLRYKNREVRKRAAEALGKIGDTRAVEPLIEALGDDDWRVRERAAEALVKIGDAKAVDALIKALGDDDSWLRWSAAYALVKIGDTR